MPVNTDQIRSFGPIRKTELPRRLDVTIPTWLPTSPSARLEDHVIPIDRDIPIVQLDPRGTLPEPRHGGKVYRTADGSVEVFGAILERYLALGGPTSWLGKPLTDELVIEEDGRLTQFEHGTIFWWPDTGAIDMDRIVVRCVGVHSFGETNESSAADELYALFGVVGPDGATVARTGIVTGVDAGETPRLGADIYAGRPAGLVVTATLMEHDHGSPDQYLGSVHKGVDAAMEAGEKALYAIPYFGAILGLAHDKLVTDEVKRDVARFISDLFGLEDDNLGLQAVTLSIKRLVVTAAHSPAISNWGVAYDFESDLYSAQSGSWKLLYSIGRA